MCDKITSIVIKTHGHIEILWIICFTSKFLQVLPIPFKVQVFLFVAFAYSPYYYKVFHVVLIVGQRYCCGNHDVELT